VEAESLRARAIVPSSGAATAVLVTAALVWMAACADGGPVSPAGEWRAVLESPGGELPFRLRIEEREAGSLIAVAVNGDEVVPIETARATGDRVVLRFDHYDSEIAATLSGDGREMRGTWVRQAGRERPAMNFRAVRGPAPRFRSDEGAPAMGAAGKAAGAAAQDVVFTDDEGESPARGEFHVDGDRLLGTFLTPTGDYRYLEGDYNDGALRLSCFDGAHAFLFHAKREADGTLAGDFWSRGAYHATWRARRAAGAPAAAAGAAPFMPDPFALTVLKNPTGRLNFAFPDVEGRKVSSSDARFSGKVVLVDIFGSWCPNCNDQAPVLVELYRRYHDRGLEIVGLAYEMTGVPARDAVFVKKHADRYGITYPLLLAGTSDKAEASLTLPDLSGVLAFPTLIFVGRDGAVAAIHTGFEGPGTGRHFEDLKTRYVKLIESLL
jgi:thiol-disulfide isomerase/thioredoxin